MLERRAWLFIMPALVVACSGRMEDGKAPSRPAGAGDVPYVPTPVATEFPRVAQTDPRLRRLTNREIENVVTDLLGTRLDVTKGFTLDPAVEGYDNDAAALGVGDSKLEEISSVAER